MKKIFILGTFLLTSLLQAGQVFYVVPNGAGNKDGTSWANAYADVQTAINAAANAGGGEVWIKAGTYKHGSAMKMKNNVEIYGGFAGTETSKDQRIAGQNRTYLDGNKSYQVFNNSYTKDNPLTNSAKLDNVTLQKGKAYALYGGGGMGNYYANPEITNCTFSDDTAGLGGGMYNVNGSPTLTNCTFSNNTARSSGGGMYSGSGSPMLTNCTFSNNTASYVGGGMYNESGSPTLTNCIFWGDNANDGKEIYIYESYSTPKFNTCIIEGGKEGIYNSAYGTYTNIITSDPKLGALGNCGGYVKTIPVLEGSSAIGAGKVVANVKTDARGIVRSTTSPTIGAYE